VSTTASLIVQRRIGASWTTVYTNSQSSTGTVILNTTLNLSSGEEFSACGYYTSAGQTILIDCDSYQGTLGGASTQDAAEVSGWALLIIIIIPLFFIGYN